MAQKEPIPHGSDRLGMILFSYPENIILGHPFQTRSKHPPETYEVARVVDGDTIKIMYEGKQQSVRLIGVNTPETVHPTKPVEPFGNEASYFLTNLLIGEMVSLQFGKEKHDKYGRLLAYVYRAPDGLFVNLEIVRQGYGRVYTREKFKQIERRQV